MSYPPASMHAPTGISWRCRRSASRRTRELARVGTPAWLLWTYLSIVCLEPPWFSQCHPYRGLAGVVPRRSARRAGLRPRWTSRCQNVICTGSAPSSETRRPGTVVRSRAAWWSSSVVPSWSSPAASRRAAPSHRARSSSWTAAGRCRRRGWSRPTAGRQQHAAGRATCDHALSALHGAGREPAYELALEHESTMTIGMDARTTPAITTFGSSRCASLS